MECNKNEHKNCINVFGKCNQICPIDCLREDHFSTNYVKFDENKNLKVVFYFWGSRNAFFSYEETPDMLLIDYFTYIGGLFGHRFGICLESLLDLIVRHARSLRTKIKLQVKKISSFIHMFSISILHCIYDLMRNIMNYLLEKVLSIRNRIAQFRI